MPARLQDRVALKALGLLSSPRSREGHVHPSTIAIPRAYYPKSISQELADDLIGLVTDMRTRNIPTEKLWMPDAEGGILKPLMHTQLDYSTKHTQHLRPQIVKEARHRLQQTPVPPPGFAKSAGPVVRSGLIIAALYFLLSVL